MLAVSQIKEKEFMEKQGLSLKTSTWKTCMPLLLTFTIEKCHLFTVKTLLHTGFEKIILSNHLRKLDTGKGGTN